MQAKAFHLIFFYSSRKDCSQGEAVGSLVHGPEKRSGGVQVTVIIHHLHNETLLFDLLVPSHSLGHLHSGQSFFFFFSFQDISFNCEPSSEFCIFYGHLMCLLLTHLHCFLSIFPLTDLFLPTLSRFQIKKEYVGFLFSRVTVFYATHWELIYYIIFIILSSTAYYQLFFMKQSSG